MGENIGLIAPVADAIADLPSPISLAAGGLGGLQSAFLDESRAPVHVQGRVKKLSRPAIDGLYQRSATIFSIIENAIAGGSARFFHLGVTPLQKIDTSRASFCAKINKEHAVPPP